MSRRLSTFAFMVGLVMAPSPGAHGNESETLDLTSPADALAAHRKIVGSIADGRPVIYQWEGNLYGRIPWERDRRLFAVQGVSVRACVSVVDPGGQPGYRMVSREVMLYLDPETRAVLDRWRNPWTGEEVAVHHVANDPVNLPMSVLARDKDQGFVFPGSVRPEQTWLSLEVPLFYPSPLGGPFQRYVGGHYRAFEGFTFFVATSDLLRRGHDLEQVSFSWTRVSPWLPWMAMGDHPGEVLVHAAGVRLSRWEEVPQPLRGTVETRFPRFRTPPPLDDSRPNASTWSEFVRLAAPPAQTQHSN